VNLTVPVIRPTTSSVPLEPFGVEFAFAAPGLVHRRCQVTQNLEKLVS